MTDHAARVREKREALSATLLRYAEIEHPHRDHPALTWKFDRDRELDLEQLDEVVAAAEAKGRAEVVAASLEPHDARLALDAAFEAGAMGDYDVDRYVAAREAYRRAVRAEAVAEAVRIVKGMNTEHDLEACPFCKFGLVCNALNACITFNGALYDVIAALQRQGGR